MDAKTIAAKQFARGAFGSYKSDDVDAFFSEVVGYVKKLEKEHDDLLCDLKILADKTEEYRASEEAVQEALVKAQKYGNKIINDAKIEAEEIGNAAKSKAEETIAVAQEKAYVISNEAMEQTEQLIRELKNKALTELNELKQKTAIERKTMEHAKVAASSFKADLFELYRAHLDLINRIPDLSEVEYTPETLLESRETAPEQTLKTQEQPEEAKTEIKEEAAPQEENAEPVTVREETVKGDESLDKAPEESPFEALAAKPEIKQPEASANPEQVTMELVMQAEEDTKQIETVAKEEEKKDIPAQAEGDTTVIPTQKIDGDKTPEDVRRTMQNTSKPVYGRKFTDLKFGSGK